MTKETNNDRKELPRWGRRALLIALAVVIVAGLIFALLPSPVPVDTAVVERETMEVAVEEDGRTRVRHDYLVSAPLSGTLLRVELEPGDRVAAGDRLAAIRSLAAPLLDPRAQAQAQAAVDAARARLEQAHSREDQTRSMLFEVQEELRNAQILLREAGGSRSGVERAEARVRSAEADLRAAELGIRVAEQELEQARLAAERIQEGEGEAVVVRAPVAGQVLEVLRESEGPVQAGSPILRMGDTSELEIVVDYLSADAVRIRPGARARIHRWGEEGSLEGRVRRVEPAGFTRISALGIEEQRVNVILDLESPREAWEALGDGFRVEARVLVWSEDDVVVAPASAVFRDGDRWAAFKIEGGRARLVEVEVGRRSDVQVQVLGGLSPGDRVIIYPGDRVEDGVRVEER